MPDHERSPATPRFTPDETANHAALKVSFPVPRDQMAGLLSTLILQRGIDIGVTAETIDADHPYVATQMVRLLNDHGGCEPAVEIRAAMPTSTKVEYRTVLFQTTTILPIHAEFTVTLPSVLPLRVS
jgi:hypothetical protein